jgi:exosortase
VSTAWRSGISAVAAGIVAAIAVRLFHPFAVSQTELSILVGAMLTSWVGGFLLFFGWRALAAARFAMAFLAFTIPMPQVLVDSATELLKRGSAEAVAALFTVTATPYHREGFVFSLPYFSIEVADACSGIRSSIALLLTALLAAHMFLQTAWKKVLLVVAIVPLVILKNGVRIVSLSLLATYVNPSFLVGRLHHDGGIVFFLLALALLLPVLAILLRSDGAVAHERQETSVFVKS